MENKKNDQNDDFKILDNIENENTNDDFILQKHDINQEFFDNDANFDAEEKYDNNSNFDAQDKYDNNSNLNIEEKTEDTYNDGYQQHEDDHFQEDRPSRFSGAVSKAKDISKKQSDTYKAFKAHDEEHEHPKSYTSENISNNISWELIKVVCYLLVISIIVPDITMFIAYLLISLVIFKLDILEPVFRFIRFLFKKN